MLGEKVCPLCKISWNSRNSKVLICFSDHPVRITTRMYICICCINLHTKFQENWRGTPSYNLAKTQKDKRRKRWHAEATNVEKVEFQPHEPPVNHTRILTVWHKERLSRCVSTSKTEEPAGRFIVHYDERDEYFDHVSCDCVILSDFADTVVYARTSCLSPPWVLIIKLSSAISFIISLSRTCTTFSVIHFRIQIVN